LTGWAAPIDSRKKREAIVLIDAKAVIIAAAALAACTQSAALTLEFKGTALAGSQGYVSPDEPSYVPTVSFVGNPVDISVTLANSPDGLYVSGYTETWSTGSYDFPYILSAGSTGYPDDDIYFFAVGVQSAVTVGASGGAIDVSSTYGYDSETDGDLSLKLNYTLSSPHGSTSSFTDNSASGGGSSDAYVNGDYDPRVGLYDADSSLAFSLSSVTQIGDIPEPATWAMMLIGFCAIGGATRSRRSRIGPRAVT
jgi:hypothetical protein